MGKGSAPRPIPDRTGFAEKYDAIFRKEGKPKPKAQIMREMRERRREEGLVEFHAWIKPQQKKAIEAILEADSY